MEFLMLGSSDGGEAEIDEKVMGEHCPRTMAAGDCLMQEASRSLISHTDQHT
jgi:hypothetical protein